MNISPAGLALIKAHEGCKLKAYLDTGGVPTIGWGHTRGVKTGDRCTQAQADTWFETEVAEFADEVDGLVFPLLSQNRFDALVSFAYNVGVEAFMNSTLLHKVNAKDYAGAAEQFGRWIYDNGKVINGLVARRADERSLFENRE